MAIYLNPVVGLHIKVQGEYRHVFTTSYGASASQGFQFASSLRVINSAIYLKARRRNSSLSVADSNRLSTDVESTVSDEQLSKANPLADSVDGNDDRSKAKTSEESVSQTAEASNGSTASRLKQDAKSSLQSTARRSPLTARERLKAARLRNRFAEPKGSKKEMGNRALKLLSDSEMGKIRSGLPEAPTNMLDDSKRGMPKPGLTFQFPGGSDLFFIFLSFATISTIMFATTYVVWKSGAIHFNEY